MSRKKRRNNPWFVNLTPHVVMLKEGPKQIRLPPARTPARISVSQYPKGYAGHFPVVTNNYGEVVGLPDPKPGVLYVVSLLVRKALGDQRPDVVAPDTMPGSVIKSDTGRVIGTKRLVGACRSQTILADRKAA